MIKTAVTIPNRQRVTLYLYGTVFTARCYALCHSKSSVCLSVCLSVTLRYVFQTGWNTSEMISRPNSLRLLLGLTPTWAIWCNGNTTKIKVVRWGMRSLSSTKNLQYLRNGARYDGLIKSHTRFRLVPKSTTLDNLERRIHRDCPKFLSTPYHLRNA